VVGQVTGPSGAAFPEWRQIDRGVTSVLAKVKDLRLRAPRLPIETAI